MDGFAAVVEVLANLSVIAICAFLVAFLLRLKGTLQALEKDVRDLTTRAMPILDNVEVITDKVRNIADNIDDQVELVKDSINSIREIANNVIDLERRIQERIEEPVLETVGTIAAVLKGVRAFFVRLKA
jgi:uncharacterized protein YoxC